MSGPWRAADTGGGPLLRSGGRIELPDMTGAGVENASAECSELLWRTEAHALAKRQWRRCLGAQAFVRRGALLSWATPAAAESLSLQEVSVQVQSGAGMGGGAAQVDETEGYYSESYPAWLATAWRSPALHPNPGRGALEVARLYSDYGAGMRTKRLLFVVTTVTKDLGRAGFEEIELSACCCLIDELRGVGEALLGELAAVEALEREATQAEERYEQAKESDDIEEEDDAHKAMEACLVRLERATVLLGRNTANADIYHDLTMQLRGRAGAGYDLEPGDKQLLEVLDARAAIKIESEAVMARRRAASNAKQTVVVALTSAKREIPRLEYQVSAKESKARKAKMAQDDELYGLLSQELLAVKDALSAAKKTLSGMLIELNEADVKVGAAETEAQIIERKVAAVAEQKKQADALVASEWNAQVATAVIHAESRAAQWPITRVHFKEAHREYNSAVVQWAHVREIDSDPTLTLEVLRTCFCARGPMEGPQLARTIAKSSKADELLDRMLDRWLPPEVLAEGAGVGGGVVEGAKGDGRATVHRQHTAQLLLGAAMRALQGGEFGEAARCFGLVEASALQAAFEGVFTYADIALFSSLCALATVDRQSDIYSLLHSPRYAPFLMQSPDATALLAEVYAGNYDRVLELLSAVDTHVHLDVFLSQHRLALFQAIQANALRFYRAKQPIINPLVAHDPALLQVAEAAVAPARAALDRSLVSVRPAKAAKLRLLDAHATLTVHRMLAGSAMARDEALVSIGRTLAIEECYARLLEQESVTQYSHGCRRMEIAGGALIFLRQQRDSSLLRRAEERAASVGTDYTVDPRQVPSSVQVTVAKARLGAALDDSGVLAGVEAVRLSVRVRAPIRHGTYSRYTRSV